MNDPLITKPAHHISRRLIVRTGVRLAYAAPLISASYGLSTFRGAANDSISSDPGDDTNRNTAPIAIVGEGFEVVDEDGDGFETVSIDGSASADSDGTIVSYLWTLGGEWVSNEPVTSISLPIGTHRILLTVTDDLGATGESTLRIRVKEGEVAEELPEESEPPSQEEPVVNLPAAPYRVEAVQKFAEVALTWLVEDGIAPPFRIYSTIDDGQGRPTDELDWILTWEEWEKLSFRDTVVEIGVPYLYVVRSFDGNNESENSNVASITLVPVEEEIPEEEAPPVEEVPVEDEPTEEDVPVDDPTAVVEATVEDAPVDEDPPDEEADSETDPSDE